MREENKKQERIRAMADFAKHRVRAGGDEYIEGLKLAARVKLEVMKEIDVMAVIKRVQGRMDGTERD